MTIKCPKKTILLFCSAYGFLATVSFILLELGVLKISESLAHVLSAVIGASLSYAAFSTVIFLGKTVRLSEEGCMIRFLFLRKFYPWTYYRTRLYQKANGQKTVAISISATLLLLPCRLRKTSCPQLWCQFLYPFSGVCLSFQSPKTVKFFEANNNLLSQLRLWNVDIDGL